MEVDINISQSLSSRKAVDPEALLCSCNAPCHADMAEGSGITQSVFIQIFRLADWVKVHNLFLDHDIVNVNLLYILAENDLPNLIRTHSSIPSFLYVFAVVCIIYRLEIGRVYCRTCSIRPHSDLETLEVSQTHPPKFLRR